MRYEDEYRPYPLADYSTDLPYFIFNKEKNKLEIHNFNLDLDDIAQDYWNPTVIDNIISIDSQRRTFVEVYGKNNFEYSRKGNGFYALRGTKFELCGDGSLEFNLKEKYTNSMCMRVGNLIDYYSPLNFISCDLKISNFDYGIVTDYAGVYQRNNEKDVTVELSNIHKGILYSITIDQGFEQHED